VVGGVERLYNAGIKNWSNSQRIFDLQKKIQKYSEWQITIELQNRLPLIDPSHITGNREMIQK
jgi:hypothetical protein